MKHWLMFCLALLLASCGGGTTPNPNPDPIESTVSWTLPSSNTPIGEPISASNHTEWVDSTGGTVLSPNGLLRVIVPSGALPNGSWVAIKSVTSNAPNALGATHRIEIGAFTNNDATAPITLEFSATGDASSSDFAALRHNSNGDWQMLPNAQVQVSNAPLNQTVRVNASSNGDYALAAKYKLYPSRASVKINASLPMTLIRLDTLNPNNLSNIEVKPMTASNWEVNGAPNGTSGLGILTPNDKPNQRTYKAPSKKPNPNPVTVSAKVGANTYTSSITIQDTDGWLDFYATSLVNKTTPTSTFKADIVAQWKINSSQIAVSPPTTILGQDTPGYYATHFLLETNSTGNAQIKFNQTLNFQCICKPNQGEFQVITEYEFTAADKLVDKYADMGFLNGNIQQDGSYELDYGDVVLTLEGDYTYKKREVNYTCGDRPQAPPIERSGKDNIEFTGRELKIAGVFKPQGPDSSRGIGTDHKELSFGSMPATSIYSWFLKYSPVKLNNAPIRLQTPPSPFSSPVQDKTSTPQPRC
jgi:hypothetical protein